MQAPKKCFVSYSRDDQRFVVRVVEKLSEAGVSVWMDTSEIRPGERWNSRIEEAVRDCDAVVVMLSPHSVHSEHVLDEIGYAKNLHKSLIPVVCETCSPPLPLVWLNHIDLRNSNLDDKKNKELQSLIEYLRIGESTGQSGMIDRRSPNAALTVEDALEMLSCAPRSLMNQLVAAMPNMLTSYERFVLLSMLKGDTPHWVKWFYYIVGGGVLAAMLWMPAPLWMTGVYALIFVAGLVASIPWKIKFKNVVTLAVRPVLAAQLPRSATGSADRKKAQRLWAGVEPILWELTSVSFSAWSTYLEDMVRDEELRKRVEAMISIPSYMIYILEKG